MKEVKETLSTMKGQVTQMTRFRKPGFLKKRNDENDDRPLLNQSSGRLGPEVAYEPPLLALPMSTTYLLPEQHTDRVKAGEDGMIIIKDESGEFSMADESLAPPSLAPENPMMKSLPSSNATGSSHVGGLGNLKQLPILNVGSSTPPPPERKAQKKVSRGPSGNGSTPSSPLRDDSGGRPRPQTRLTSSLTKSPSPDDGNGGSEDRRRRRFLGIGRPFTKSKEDTRMMDMLERRGSSSLSDGSLDMLEATVQKVQSSDYADSFAQMTFESPPPLSSGCQPIIPAVQEDDESMGDDTVEPLSLAAPSFENDAHVTSIQDSLHDIDEGVAAITWTRNKPVVRKEQRLATDAGKLKGAETTRKAEKIVGAGSKESRVRRMKAEIESRERRGSTAKSGRTTRRHHADSQTVGSGDKSHATGRRCHKSRRRLNGGKVSDDHAEDDLSRESSDDPADDPLLGSVVSPDKMDAESLENEIRLILKLGKPRSPNKESGGIPSPSMGSSPVKEPGKERRRPGGRRKSLTVTDAEFFLAATDTTKSPSGTVSRASSERDMMVWRRESGPAKTAKHLNDSDERPQDYSRRHNQADHAPYRRGRNGRRRRSMDYPPPPPLEGVTGENAYALSPITALEPSGSSSPRRSYSTIVRPSENQQLEGIVVDGTESSGFSSPRRSYSTNVRPSGQQQHLVKGRGARRGSIGQADGNMASPIASRRRGSLTHGVVDAQQGSPARLRGRPSSEAVVATAGLNVIDKVRVAPSRRASADNIGRPLTRTRSRRRLGSSELFPEASLDNPKDAPDTFDDRDNRGSKGEGTAPAKPPSFHRMPSVGMDDLIGEVQEAIRVARSGTDEEKAAEHQTKIQETEQLDREEAQTEMASNDGDVLDPSAYGAADLTDVSEQSNMRHPSRSERFSSKLIDGAIPVSEESENESTPANDDDKIAPAPARTNELPLPQSTTDSANVIAKKKCAFRPCEETGADKEENEDIAKKYRPKESLDSVEDLTKGYDSAQKYAKLLSLLASSSDRVEMARKEVSQLEAEIERLQGDLGELTVNVERNDVDT